jgi:hypothetical protein
LGVVRRMYIKETGLLQRKSSCRNDAKPLGLPIRRV